MVQNPLISSFDRRLFLKTAGALAASSALLSGDVLGANERIRIALVGSGRRGRGLLKRFVPIPGVDLVALCDPDMEQMAGTSRWLASEVSKGAKWATGLNVDAVDHVQDYRKLYERSDIDAVVIASPNYWHTLHAIQAMQAGKHVYVEKPVTFTVWEGLQLQAAEKKYGKIIAAGYQNRSDKGPRAGIEYVQAGNLGKIRSVRSICYRNRSSIGKQAEPLTPPSSMDYDLWLGPMQDKPMYRPQFHYDWHWDFNTGNGDVGNQGVHEIDLVCWLLGEPQLPSQVQSVGNRFAWNDAGDTPNMQVSWFKCGDVDVILDTNDMKLAPDRNVSPNYLGTRVGIVAECENGILRGGRGGMVAVESDGRTVIEKFPGDAGRDHQKNFIDAIRANDASMLASKISEAHRSASMAHLGNISYRSGIEMSGSDLNDAIGGNVDVQAIIAKQSEQLKAWGISEPRYRCGPALSVDPKSETVLTSGIGAELTGPFYRKGFEVPKYA